MELAVVFVLMELFTFVDVNVDIYAVVSDVESFLAFINADINSVFIVLTLPLVCIDCFWFCISLVLALALVVVLVVAGSCVVRFENKNEIVGGDSDEFEDDAVVLRFVFDVVDEFVFPIIVG